MVAKTSALSIFLAIASSSMENGTTNAFSPSIPSTNTASNSRFALLAAKKKIFIDGEAGTTGLQVRDRLAGREDLEIISISDELRKDMGERKRLINEADCVILCKLFIASIFSCCTRWNLLVLSTYHFTHNIHESLYSFFNNIGLPDDASKEVCFLFIQYATLIGSTYVMYQYENANSS